MYSAAICALIVAMTLAIIRGIRGPTIYDRILALSSFGTKTVIMIALLDFFAGRPTFIDIALVYALINFLSTIAVLRFFEHGNLGGVQQSTERSKPK